MLLLHLSDLHFGNKNRFASIKPQDLADAFAQSLDAARGALDLPESEKISLAVVTGDLAEVGLPSEFESANNFFTALARKIDLSHQNFVFLPGNHDISWSKCKKIRAACADEEFPKSELDTQLQLVKLANYYECLHRFYGHPITDTDFGYLPDCHPLANGGWVRDFPTLRVAVAALNTSEREDDVKRGGFLSNEQAQSLIDTWKLDAFDDRIKIVALHHNPIATTPDNRYWTLEWLREIERKTGVAHTMSNDAFEHYRSDLAGFIGSEHLPKIVRDTEPQLVLHGHHHDQGDPVSWHWKSNGGAPVLSVGSFGLKKDQLPGDAPLSCQLIRFVFPAKQKPPRLLAIPLVFDPRYRVPGRVSVGGFRVETDARSAYDQPLSMPPKWNGDDLALIPESDATKSAPQFQPDSIPRPPVLYADPPYISSHSFVGRKAQLDTLDDWASPANTHPVLLFEAIGGSGKSMLTWEWTTKHARKLRSNWSGLFWYSFYEKGATMVDFCRRALAYITGQPRTLFKEKSTAELTGSLLQQLQDRPWLLVLDGLERVLVAYHRIDASQIPDEEAGNADVVASRNPCSAINPEDDDLLRTLTNAQPSKLLITSRLVPTALINRSNRPLPGVLREILPGLRPKDAELLLRACGIKGNSDNIQTYLTTHCDCHPLVIGVLAGVISDYLPDRGNFDAWANDPNGGGSLNLANLNLDQKRNHILSTALSALPPKSRELLSTLALLSEAVDYSTLRALDPNLMPLPEAVDVPKDPQKTQDWRKLSQPERDKALSEFATAVDKRGIYEQALSHRTAEIRLPSEHLTEIIKDLERRGLLQYNEMARRYDLHPVVRGIAAGGLKTDEKYHFGQRVIDHFSQQSQNPYEAATSLDDFANARRIVQALFHMGKIEQARDFVLRGGFIQYLNSKFEAHSEILAIIRGFFSADWHDMQACLKQRGGITLANRASVSLRRINALPEALSVSELALQLILDRTRGDALCSELLNISSTLGEQNRLADEDRILLLAEEMSSVHGRRNDLLSVDLARLRQFAKIGYFDKAHARVRNLQSSQLTDSETAIINHHTALCLFFEGTLTEQFLAEAEKSNRNVESAIGIRNLCGLRGVWQLELENWDLAKISLEQAVTLAHKAGKSDHRSEVRLAIAKHHLGIRHDFQNIVEQPLVGLDASSARPLAELLVAQGDFDNAKAYALSSLEWAVADGEPFVRRYELNKTLRLFRKIEMEVTSPMRNATMIRAKFAWEDSVKAVIQRLKEEILAE